MVCLCRLEEEEEEEEEVWLTVESCSCMSIMWSPSRMVRLRGAAPDKKSFTWNRNNKHQITRLQCQFRQLSLYVLSLYLWLSVGEQSIFGDSWSPNKSVAEILFLVISLWKLGHYKLLRSVKVKNASQRGPRLNWGVSLRLWWWWEQSRHNLARGRVFVSQLIAINNYPPVSGVIITPIKSALLLAESAVWCGVGGDGPQWKKQGGKMNLLIVLLARKLNWGLQNLYFYIENMYQEMIMTTP